jgi:hypothetical protein
MASLPIPAQRVISRLRESIANTSGDVSVRVVARLGYIFDVSQDCQ